jgi:hypothetical protein
MQKYSSKSLRVVNYPQYHQACLIDIPSGMVLHQDKDLSETQYTQQKQFLLHMYRIYNPQNYRVNRLC